LAVALRPAPLTGDVAADAASAALASAAIKDGQLLINSLAGWTPAGRGPTGRSLRAQLASLIITS
jgi:hypothetical protein